MTATSAEWAVRGFAETELPALERTLAGVLDELDARTPAVLTAPIRYAIEAGGKRMRPLLCIAAFRAVRDAAAGPGAGGAVTPEAVREIAASLELIHTYSLVHDDLPCMDDAALRRGVETTHRRFGPAAATAAGAAMIPLAVAWLDRGARRLRLEAAERAGLVAELCGAAGAAGMVGGQVLDLEAEGVRLGLAELEDVHRRKTGALLTAALRMGARAARADDRRLEALGRYGAAVGLAFQIADDLLDLTGEVGRTGKTAGGDVAHDKATFPKLLGEEGARARGMEEVERAVLELRVAALADPVLEALARYAFERDR